MFIHSIVVKLELKESVFLSPTHRYFFLRKTKISHCHNLFLKKKVEQHLITVAENETRSSNNEPKGDVKKLIRIRGGHKGAFTKSESKIDLMLSQSIVNEEQLCEAEALLANLKNLWNLLHRYDAEIELLIDDEDELSSEID